MRAGDVFRLVEDTWDDSIIPKLCEYIRIPNKSPLFDPQWKERGHMDEATRLLADWCREQDIAGMKVEVVELEGRTPLIFIEIEGQVDDTVLLYGHLDKQPEFTGWKPHLGPWKPVIEDGKLYGRGGALQEQGVPHARCVVLIEGCEESGSFDLPHYVEHLRDRIGSPSLVVCLDAECGNYDQLWCTTNLRGNLVGTLRVSVLEEGVHSGGASGVAADSFRILRLLLDRLEDPETGRTRVPALDTEIPSHRIEQAEAAATVLDMESFRDKYPFTGEGRPITDDPAELILNNTWRATLTVVGMDGIPSIADGGNVLRPRTDAKLSFRLPPNCDPEKAAAAVKEVLEADPPYGAEVSFEVALPNPGWEAPPIAPWLHGAMDQASREFFDGRQVMYMGTGGTIPFMSMLGDMFPDSQFLVTGLLGPRSNAHGPNEFLHIPFARRLTTCVSRVLADHCQREGG